MRLRILACLMALLYAEPLPAQEAAREIMSKQEAQHLFTLVRNKGVVASNTEGVEVVRYPLVSRLKNCTNARLAALGHDPGILTLVATCTLPSSKDDELASGQLHAIIFPDSGLAHAWWHPQEPKKRARPTLDMLYYTLVVLTSSRLGQ